MIELFLLLATILLLRISRMSLMRYTSFLHLTKNIESCDLRMIGWRKPKSIKDHLLSAKIECESSSDNKRAPCCRSRGQFCSFLEERTKSETFGIRKVILNCSSNMVVYLVQCKSCSKRYVGSTITSFRFRFNIYNSGARNLSKVYPD